MLQLAPAVCIFLHIHINQPLVCAVCSHFSVHKGHYFLQARFVNQPRAQSYQNTCTSDFFLYFQFHHHDHRNFPPILVLIIYCSEGLLTICTNRHAIFEETLYIKKEIWCQDILHSCGPHRLLFYKFDIFSSGNSTLLYM